MPIFLLMLTLEALGHPKHHYLHIHYTDNFAPMRSQTSVALESWSFMLSFSLS